MRSWETSGRQRWRKRAKRGGVLGSATKLGEAIVDMQKNVDGLQKNIDVLKKVKSSLGGVDSGCGAAHTTAAG